MVNTCPECTARVFINTDCFRFTKWIQTDVWVSQMKNAQNSKIIQERRQQNCGYNSKLKVNSKQTGIYVNRCDGKAGKPGVQTTMLSFIQRKFITNYITRCPTDKKHPQMVLRTIFWWVIYENKVLWK